jgi:hypothetical protein
VENFASRSHATPFHRRLKCTNDEALKPKAGCGLRSYACRDGHSVQFSRGSSSGAKPTHRDLFGTWPLRRLLKMDSKFCDRVERALRSGEESMAAARATYGVRMK